ncbi:MAG: RNA methyltransferase [Saprospiraceae bacterium]|nr:RNA methyltransferase [Saprospiraceae bacterium]
MRKLKLDELNRLSINEFKEADKTPFIVVLDNIRSAYNVGSIFRTCDALAIEEIILTGITAKPPHKEISKSAIGATNSVAWRYEADIVSCIRELKDKGHLIIGIEQTNESISLNDYQFEGGPLKKYVIIFGNEVEGLNAELLPLLDDCIEIPQYGTKHSFNVSVCAGIVLWALRDLL